MSSAELDKDGILKGMNECRRCGSEVAPIGSGEYVFHPSICHECAVLIREEEKGKEQAQERENHLRGLGLRPLWWELDFDQFTVEVDQPVKEACIRYVNGWPQTNGLILYSKAAGTGKSMLAACILKHVDKGWWANAAELLEAIRRSFDDGQPEIYKRSFSAPLLVIDDLGAHKVSEWTIEMFYTLLNYRIEEMLPTIITTNVKNISSVFGERVASRIFGHCDTLTLKGADYRRS